ncbi:MAG: heme ABC transporter substrate-binding protein IsdE [Tissierellia bacterium]|nr:heme ABC transporter substrate-binding protein IsdE [Tissierellia bacterium]
MTNKFKILLFLLILTLGITSCVDQSGPQAEREIKPTGEYNKIVATSMAVTDICDKLELDLVGVPSSNISTVPKRYEGIQKVGMAMTPDMEIIKGLDPDMVLSPVSLISDLLPKYENLKLKYGFLNLNNVDGMYKSIEDMGKLFGKEEQANQLLKEYKEFMEPYQKRIEGKSKPKVLLLMGLPGSYIVATPNSYVGDLVRLAGGENVYSDSDQQFININVEDMLEKDPDIILRTAHALPEDVMEMFAKEFEQNDTWKHFRAVKEGKVKDLNYDRFGMSAKFNYTEALKDLEEIFNENR